MWNIVEGAVGIYRRYVNLFSFALSGADEVIEFYEVCFGPPLGTLGVLTSVEVRVCAIHHPGQHQGF